MHTGEYSHKTHLDYLSFLDGKQLSCKGNKNHVMIFTDDNHISQIAIDNPPMERDRKMVKKTKPPFATYMFIVLNTIGLIYEFSVGQNQAIRIYGMYQGAIKDGEYLRMIVSAFLHFGIYHFGSNMICLIIYGFSLERQIGSLKFIVIYVAAIIGGSILIDYTGGYAIHAGASSAIWGLMAATLIYNIQHSINPVYALRGIIINLLYSFGANVSWQGHIGGGIAGVLAALMLCGQTQYYSIDDNHE